MVYLRISEDFGSDFLSVGVKGGGGEGGGGMKQRFDLDQGTGSPN